MPSPTLSEALMVRVYLLPFALAGIIARVTLPVSSSMANTPSLLPRRME